MSDDLTDSALGRMKGVHDTWCDDRAGIARTTIDRVLSAEPGIVEDYSSGHLEPGAIGRARLEAARLGAAVTGKAA